MKTIGIIGLGSIGMRHAENLLEMGHQVIGYDPDDARMGIFRALGGDTFEDPSEFHQAKKNAVVIASPTKLHVLHIMAILPFKDEKIFVEKPIAESQVIGLGYADLSRITVGNNVRFHGCVQQAKAWLPDIGKPLWANFTVAQYNARPEYLRDGVTLNWGAHEMDLALYLLGPAQVVGASISKDDNISQILLLHENGCRSMLHLDYLTREEVRTFMIQGESDLIACNLPAGQIAARHHSPYYDGDWNETYVLEMQAFIDGDKNIAASGEDGLRCLKLLLDAKSMGGL